MDLKIEGIERTLRARFVEVVTAVNHLQLSRWPTNS